MNFAYARPTSHSKGLSYIALVVIVFCSYSVWIWYRGVHEQLESIHSAHSLAVAEAKSRAFEYDSLQEKLEQLKASHSTEIAEALSQIDTLNATSTDTGYARFPDRYLDGGEDVVVIIKTGATEIYKSLPIHLATTLTHTPNHLLFSDHEQQIAQYKIQDALDEVSDWTMQNKDFELYKDQKQSMATGQSPEYLELKGGWELDKYKNIHMMKKTWKQRPNAKWYLFIDADSYVMLSNLLPYLRGLDHTKRLYMGSPAVVKSTNFGHGGTGYVVSHGAMQYVMQEDPDIPHKYEQMAKDNCCGDYVFAEAMKAHGIELSFTNPNFFGEGPAKIDYDAPKHCQPLITMHHMRPSEISDAWTFERNFAQPDRYILFQDVFNHFVYPHLREYRNEWDNMGGKYGDVENLPKDLFKPKMETRYDEAKNETVMEERELSKEEKREKVWKFCEKSCRDKGQSGCMQFRVWKEECKLHNRVTLGNKVPVTWGDKEEYNSGWLMERVEVVRKMKCEQPKKGWPQSAVSGA